MKKKIKFNFEAAHRYIEYTSAREKLMHELFNGTTEEIESVKNLAEHYTTILKDMEAQPLTTSELIHNYFKMVPWLCSFLESPKLPRKYLKQHQLPECDKKMGSGRFKR